jgi:hypothetical protein
MRNLPPTRDISAIVASLTGAEPEQLVRDGVRRVKQVMEAGEVIVADGTSTGRDGGRDGGRHTGRDRFGRKQLKQSKQSKQTEQTEQTEPAPPRHAAVGGPA